jgi:hypothetical protein
MPEPEHIDRRRTALILRRLPARADSVGFCTQGRDAPGGRCLGSDDRSRPGGGRTGDLHDARQPLRPAGAARNQGHGKEARCA